MPTASFDDYDYKYNQYFEFKFKQRRDEKMLPWEMAGFITNFNTIYYKNDLLNSISSCLLMGISPKDIFIFDGTLPLNKKYSTLNVIEESEAACNFYNIGKPYSIWPNRKTYEINFLYEFFNSVNSLLHSRHFKPLKVNNLRDALKIQSQSGSKKAEIFIIELASKTSKEYHEKYSKHYSDRTPLDENEIKEKTQKLSERHEKSLSIIDEIDILTDEQFTTLMISGKRQDIKYKNEINKFHQIFSKVNRPVVCARIGNGNIRVLARSLVNKSSFGSLELKEAKKNSPAEFLFLGLSVAIKAGIEIKHQLDINNIDLAIKKIELEKATLELEKTKIELETSKEEKRKVSAQADKAETELSHANNIKNIEESDINFFQKLPESPTKRNLAIAYSNMEERTRTIFNEYGISYVENSFRPINIKA